MTEENTKTEDSASRVYRFKNDGHDHRLTVVRRPGEPSSVSIERLDGWDSLGVGRWLYIDIDDDDVDLVANDWLAMAVWAVESALLTPAAIRLADLASDGTGETP